MTFARLLSEAIASDGLPRTGDVLAVSLPLLHEIAELHDAGLTSGLASAHHHPGQDHLCRDDDPFGWPRDLCAAGQIAVTAGGRFWHGRQGAGGAFADGPVR